MDFSRLNQLQLSHDTKIKPFKCAEDDLNGFLYDDAKHFQAELMAVTYLLEDNEGNATVAYFSLLADKISFNPDDKSVWNRRIVLNMPSRGLSDLVAGLLLLMRLIQQYGFMRKMDSIFLPN